MRRLTYSIVFAVAACLFAAQSASASTITVGTFFYEVDFLFGPTFTVSNTSILTTEGTFTDVTVDLLDASPAYPSMLLGTIVSTPPANASVSTSDDLTGVSFTSARVTLTFTPLNAPSTHLSAIASLNNLPDSTDGIDLPETLITVDVPQTPTPVPEPGSLTLVGSGAIFVFRRTALFRTRRRRARAGTTAHVAP